MECITNILIGPLSGKVTGQMIAFKDLRISKSLKLDIKSPFAIIHNLFICIRAENVYITGSRTLIGFIRDTLFILPYLVLKKPVYIHIHGDDIDVVLNSKIKFLVKYIYRYSNLIVANTAQLSLLKDDFKVEYVPNYSRFSMLKSDLSLPLKRRYGYVSSVSREKGIFDWLKIVSSLNCESEFLIAGPMRLNRKDEIHFYQQIKRIEKQGKKITWVGTLDANKMRKLYSELTDLIYVSKHPTENMPLVLLEAASMCVMLHVTTHRNLHKRFGLKTNAIILNQFSYDSSNVCNYVPKLILSNYSHVNKNYSIESYNTKLNNILKWKQ